MQLKKLEAKNNHNKQIQIKHKTIIKNKRMYNRKINKHKIIITNKRMHNRKTSKIKTIIKSKKMNNRKMLKIKIFQKKRMVNQKDQTKNLKQWSNQNQKKNLLI